MHIRLSRYNRLWTAAETVASKEMPKGIMRLVPDVLFGAKNWANAAGRSAYCGQFGGSDCPHVCSNLQSPLESEAPW